MNVITDKYKEYMRTAHFNTFRFVEFDFTLNVNWFWYKYRGRIKNNLTEEV